MTKTKVMNWLQKNTMTLILVLVFAFFAWRTEGKILMPNNISNLIAQNAYVFILATGMLLCILTGGNIDLAVGSVVCFAGAVGALMMANGTNMWVAVVVMLGIGLAVGAFQAFCIAYIKVPPFITTLAGQLIFRGLSNVVLGGKTCTVSNEQFLKVFGGGAECYVPDFFGGETINYLCVAVGILACVLYIALTLRTRIVRIKKGYAVEGWLSVIGRMVVLSAVCLFFFTKLA
jgi:putative multiple sugar transport system permease protein